MTKSNKQPEWLTPSQVAEALGVSKQRISQLIKLGRLSVVVLDGRQYIKPADVESLKEQKTTPRKKSRAEVYRVTIESIIKVERIRDDEIEESGDEG
jgi:excisionase family DNA binding protein